MGISKNWLFPMALSGYGDTPEEAWEDVCEALLSNDEFWNLPEGYQRNEPGDLPDEEGAEPDSGTQAQEPQP
jgi:hypothetical protein